MALVVLDQGPGSRRQGLEQGRDLGLAPRIGHTSSFKARRLTEGVKTKVKVK